MKHFCSLFVLNGWFAAYAISILGSLNARGSLKLEAPNSIELPETTAWVTPTFSTCEVQLTTVEDDAMNGTNVKVCGGFNGSMTDH